VFRRFALKYRFYLGLSAVYDNIPAALYDACLCPGNIHYRRPELLYMVIPNRGDDRNFRDFDNICRVQLATHANLKDDYIAAFFQEELHRQRRDKLKLSRRILHRIGKRPYLLCHAYELVVGYMLPIHLHPLVEAQNVRRYVQARPVTGLLKDSSY
jgi:hypothetical protein